MDTKPITRNDSTFVKQTQDTTHTQTGLNNASRYYFQVTAINSGNYEVLLQALIFHHHIKDQFGGWQLTVQTQEMVVMVGHSPLY